MPGMNLVDTSDVYGFDWGGTGFGQVEEILGRVLAAAPSLRERMVLATKGGIAPPTPYDSSARLPAVRVRGIAAAAPGRRHRPLPDPPSRPVHPSRRRGADARRTARRRQDPRGRRLEPHGRPGRGAGGTPAVPARHHPARVLGAPARPAARRHVRRTACATASSRWHGARSPAVPGHRRRGRTRTARRARRARRSGARRPQRRRRSRSSSPIRPRPVAIIGSQTPSASPPRRRARRAARSPRRVPDRPSVRRRPPAMTSRPADSALTFATRIWHRSRKSCRKREMTEVRA